MPQANSKPSVSAQIEPSLVRALQRHLYSHAVLESNYRNIYPAHARELRTSLELIAGRLAECGEKVLLDQHRAEHASYLPESVGNDPTSLEKGEARIALLLAHSITVAFRQGDQSTAKLLHELRKNALRRSKRLKALGSRPPLALDRPLRAVRDLSTANRTTSNSLNSLGSDYGATSTRRRHTKSLLTQLLCPPGGGRVHPAAT